VALDNIKLKQGAVTGIDYFQGSVKSYIDSIPTDKITIDGAFQDWNSLSFVKTYTDSPTGTFNEDINLVEYKLAQDPSSLSFYFEVAGEMLNGMRVPASSYYYSTLPAALDSDGDGVPDHLDPNPNEIPPLDSDDDRLFDDYETAISHTNPNDRDSDDDGAIDSEDHYPLDPYKIKEPLAPWILGQDQAFIFIDNDHNIGTGYKVQGSGNKVMLGAEYMIEITGKYGYVLKSLYNEYSGKGKDWTWTSVGNVDVGKDRTQLETQVGLTQVDLVEDQEFDIFFYMTDWNYDNIDYSNLVSFNTVTNTTGDNGNTTRHGVDGINGGFGLIPRKLINPVTFDGSILTYFGEWGEAAYDYNNDANGQIWVYGKYDDNYLYVAVDSQALLGIPDYMEIAFDTNHDGGSLESTDYKFRLTDPFTTPVTLTSYVGSSGSWSNQTISWGGNATAGIYEFRIPLQYVWDNGTSSTRGEMAGFQVHYEHGEGGGFDGYQYWTRESGAGDDSTYIDDPDYFGDLIYENTSLLINEVASAGKYNVEWVEIFNLGPDPVHLKGIMLSDQEGDSANDFEKLWTTMVWLAPGDYAVIYGQSGTDDTSKSGGTYSGWWEFFCGGSGGDNFLADAGDDLLLNYPGNDCALDYMEYGTGGTACPTSWPSWGLTSKGWDDTGQPSAPGAGESVQRYKWTNGNPYDSNAGSDWYLNTSGQLPGVANWRTIPEFENVLLPIGFSLSIMAMVFIDRKRKK
jgi:hypothetical protein